MSTKGCPQPDGPPCKLSSIDPSLNGDHSQDNKYGETDCSRVMTLGRNSSMSRIGVGSRTAAERVITIPNKTPNFFVIYSAFSVCTLFKGRSLFMMHAALHRAETQIEPNALNIQNTVSD